MTLFAGGGTLQHRNPSVLIEWLKIRKVLKLARPYSEGKSYSFHVLYALRDGRKIEVEDFDKALFQALTREEILSVFPRRSAYRLLST